MWKLGWKLFNSFQSNSLDEEWYNKEVSEILDGVVSRWEDWAYLGCSIVSYQGNYNRKFSGTWIHNGVHPSFIITVISSLFFCIFFDVWIFGDSGESGSSEISMKDSKDSSVVHSQDCATTLLHKLLHGDNYASKICQYTRNQWK